MLKREENEKNLKDSVKCTKLKKRKEPKTNTNSDALSCPRRKYLKTTLLAQLGNFAVDELTRGKDR